VSDEKKIETRRTKMKKLIKKTSAEYGQFEDSLKKAGIEYRKYSAPAFDCYEYTTAAGQQVEAIATANGVDGDCEVIEFYAV
jgi:hypothetical protein